MDWLDKLSDNIMHWWARTFDTRKADQVLQKNSINFGEGVGCNTNGSCGGGSVNNPNGNTPLLGDPNESGSSYLQEPQPSLLGPASPLSLDRPFPYPDESPSSESYLEITGLEGSSEGGINPEYYAAAGLAFHHSSDELSTMGLITMGAGIAAGFTPLAPLAPPLIYTGGAMEAASSAYNVVSAISYELHYHITQLAITTVEFRHV